MFEGQVRFAITAPDVCLFVVVSNISHFEHLFWHYWTIGSRKKLFRNEVCEANYRNSQFILSWHPPPSLLRRCVLDTKICDKVCRWLAAGRWFSPGIPVSSTEIHLALRFMLLFLVLCSVICELWFYNFFFSFSNSCIVFDWYAEFGSALLLPDMTIYQAFTSWALVYKPTNLSPK